MTDLLINEKIDIYQYPTDYFEHRNSITIGDLHGNTVKLIHFLMSHQVIKFKDTVENKHEAYQQFVTLYEQFGEIIETRLDYATKIRVQDQCINNHTQKIARYNELASIVNKNESEEIEFGNLAPERSAGFIVTAKAEKVRLDVEMAEELTKLPTPAELINQLNEFINQLEVHNKDVLVRLIGDEFADRGSCDYFTLRVLHLLAENNVKTNIPISNHSVEFITAYEKFFSVLPFKPLDIIADAQKPSILGLQLLLKERLITPEEISDMVNCSYKPCLKVLDYTLNEEGITLFTHAPVRFDVIRHLADTLRVVYCDTTKESLAATIDKINTKFQQIVKENKVHEYFQNLDNIDITHMQPQQIAEQPLVNIAWNRWNDEKETDDARPAEVNGYRVTCIHGHDTYQSKLAHVINLDTNSGKSSRKEQQKLTSQLEVMLQIPATILTAKEKAGFMSTLESMTQYKVFMSDEKALGQIHDPVLIEEEFLQQSSMPDDKRSKLITGLSTAVGLAVGVGTVAALTYSGLIVPVSLASALSTGGAATVGGAFGLATAKATSKKPVQTVVDTDPAEDNSDGNRSIRALSRLSTSLGTCSKPQPDLSDNCADVVAFEQKPDPIVEEQDDDEIVPCIVKRL